MSDELTSGQAAEILGVTRRQVSRLIASGALTPRRRAEFTGWYVLDRADVERYRDRSVSTTH